MTSNSNNIKVCCRFRPYNTSEMSEELHDKITFDGHKITVKKDEELFFYFDYVFKEDSSQEEVYEFSGCKEMVDELLKGYNCTIFAYGMTSSGKTTSLMGTPGFKGITPRIVEDIFLKTSEKRDDVKFKVIVSYVEIYLEKVRDLLDPTKENLSIREGGFRDGIWIQDVKEENVTSHREALQIIKKGNLNRSTAETKMNERSSRSHSVFILSIEQDLLITGVKRFSKLIIIDLAGSEKVSKTGASGLTLKQAQHTNRSLSALGNVIRSICDRSTHIPYRDSKLTRILTDSLGGNSKTCLLVTCSPALSNLEETISTLRFGSQVKTIKNRPKINEEKSLDEYKRLLEEAYKRIHFLEKNRKVCVSEKEEKEEEKEEKEEKQKENIEYMRIIAEKDDEIRKLCDKFNEEIEEKDEIIRNIEKTLKERERQVRMLEHHLGQTTEHLEKTRKDKDETISVVETLETRFDSSIDTVAKMYEEELQKLRRTNREIIDEYEKKIKHWKERWEREWDRQEMEYDSFNSI